jgi:hypothetical protein
MKDLIQQFKIHAKQLNRDANSVNELKLWFSAHKNVKFDKIFQENNGFKTEDAYDIIKVLREKYKLPDEEIGYFIKTYIVNPSPELTATYELDRTEGRPGTSYEEINEALVGMG